MTSPIKILYVDDESINLLLFHHTFKKKYDVLTAESGFKGLELLSDNSDTKVIISDMKMPGMDGIEFIKEAKRLYPFIIFYILTGYEITPEIQDALDTGLINGYFQKPFKMKDIEDTILGNIES
jgi:two-component system, response regulator, stage 0 sporulation protein F